LSWWVSVNRTTVRYVKKATGPRSGSSTAFTRSDALPVLGEPAAERADAQRNRLKILDAAERLFAANGIANVSMDAVAKAAGVGKGTLFRRFGDRAGLAVALLDERERELQERILHGPAPLGPSASPRNRLLAFLSAYADFLEAHGDVVLESETAVAGARYRVGVYHFWHRHVTVLLEQAAPHVDAEYQAHALLAPLAADLYHALRRSGVPAKRIRDGVRALAIALLDAQRGRARS
jgi:AcrR family transcriptional regulator